ncbi:MAG: large conductance mechanosensitive channel protein MscL [Gemmataceae bacterium]
MDPLQRLHDLAPVNKAFSLWDEFKSFALKGNIVDLAVAVMLGAAFNKVVDSLVKNGFTPLISTVTGQGGDWPMWRAHLGAFLGDVFSFLLIAFILFIFIVKFLGMLMQAKKEEPKVTKEQELLTEIRDLLKAKASSD